MLDLVRLRGILDQVGVAGDMSVDVVVDTNDISLSFFNLWSNGHCVETL